MIMTNQSFQKQMQLAPAKQAGVVLVLALVMLTVLTLIGVASMNSSTLELKVSSNMQQRNIAFQGAEARLAFAASNDAANPVDFLVRILDLNNPSSWPVQTCNSDDAIPCPNGTDWKATATISYLDCGKDAGNSLESGKSFAYRVFEIVSTGQTSNGSARSVQASAIKFPVKGCGDEI